MKSLVQQVDFDNTELAFRARSGARLRRDYLLFRLIDSPTLTRIGPPLLERALRWGLPVTGVVRKTLFALFCGGESLVDSAARSDLLYRHGVHTILDYAVEGGKDEAGFEATCAEILEAIAYAGQQEAVAFTACKMTGLASMDLMTRVQAGVPLTAADEAAFARVKARAERLAQAAQAAQTPIFIDAEESWIQDVIDGLAEDLMARYNRDTPLVWTTVQLYRHDRLAYLDRLIARSRAEGWILGVKLVRGAYLDKENRRALAQGYATPMQPHKAATDRDFDAALAHCVAHIDHVALCAGTHNEQSGQHLVQLMAAHGLPAGHPHIWFAQLLGMSDHISFNLSHAGYQVAKYLPYGPVRAVLPYLIRRAEENTAIAGQSSREVDLLRRERQRRKGGQ